MGQVKSRVFPYHLHCLLTMVTALFWYVINMYQGNETSAKSSMNNYCENDQYHEYYENWYCSNQYADRLAYSLVRIKRLL